MPATIQTPNKPLHPRVLDTSGNNNHGTPYTGQALEFDGVADYITMPIAFMDNATAVTVSLWFKTTGANGGMIAKYANSSMYAWWITVKGSKLCANINRDQSAQSDLLSTGDVDDGVWHYATLTWSYSSGLASLYLDGVLIDTDANTNESDLRTGILLNSIGVQGYISSGTVTTQAAGWYDGLMSNVQIWDTVLTASDVSYAYLNPEKLALDNPGTSLTYSDLKLWYPMQDGHRGNQSFLLDGANTGLNREIWVDGIAAEGMSSNWYSTNAGDSTDLSITYSGGEHIIASNHDGGDTAALAYLTYRVAGGSSGSLSEAQVPGTNYKLTFAAKYSGAAPTTRFVMDGVVWYSPTLTTEYVTYETYFPYNASISSVDTYWQVQSIAEGDKVYFKDISVKPVNDKNHGTSVFYGDELVTNGDSDSTLPTINSQNLASYDAASFAISTAITGSTATYNGVAAGDDSILVTADSSSTYPLIRFLDGTDCGLVTGRTYYISCYVYIPASQTLDTVTLQALDNGGSTISLGGAGATTTTDTWVKLYGSYVSDDPQRCFEVRGSGGDVSDEIFYVDQISIKEVGFATGWTDADAQPTIPQLGFQSYNQLAWLDGTADYVEMDSNFDIDVASEDWSISAWVYIQEYAANSAYINIFGNTKDTNNRIGIQCYDQEADSPKTGIVTWNGSAYTGAKSDSMLTLGAWHHVVGTCASNTLKFYVNGVLQSGTNNTASLYNANKFMIGANANGEATFKGAITEVSVLNEVLTLAKVQELYNDGEALDALTHSSVANLVGYWRNEGSSEWTDLSIDGNGDSNGNHGDPQSITENLILPEGQNNRDTQGFLMNSVRNNGLNNDKMNNIASYIDIGSTTLAAGTAYSMMAWLKPSDLSTNYWFGSGVNYFSINTSSSILVNHNNVGDSFTVSEMTVDEWLHLAIVRDTSNLVTVYVDGIANGGATLDTETADQPFTYQYIGATGTNPTYTFNGQIDDVAIYDTELSAAQVLRNYKAGKGRHRN